MNRPIYLNDKPNLEATEINNKPFKSVLVVGI